VYFGFITSICNFLSHRVGGAVECSVAVDGGGNTENMDDQSVTVINGRTLKSASASLSRRNQAPCRQIATQRRRDRMAA